MSLSVDQRLVDTFAPHIYFARDEVCFPISINQYLQECKIVTPDRIILQPSIDVLYEEFRAPSTIPLQFLDNNWEVKLRGAPDEAVCYVRVMQAAPHVYHLIYMYLFSHTEPYHCCGFGPRLTCYAHRADLKYLVVEVVEEQKEHEEQKEAHLLLSRVYFGAHGSNGGVWRSAADVELNDTHVTAYAATGDHSFYPHAGFYGRIFNVASDFCDHGYFSRPRPQLLYPENSPHFIPSIDGWVYFGGKMNVDGIDPPAKQGFWNNQISKFSNNWFRRLFCPAFW